MIAAVATTSIGVQARALTGGAVRFAADRNAGLGLLAEWRGLFTR